MKLLVVELMASIVRNLWVSPCFALSSEYKPRFRVRVSSVSGGESATVSKDSSGVNGFTFVGEKERVLSDVGNGRVDLSVKEKKSGKDAIHEKLKPLWDDGYGTQTVRDYFDLAEEIIKPDGGPPRWFCPVECGRPVKNAPVLLFLPGNSMRDKLL